MNNKAFTLDELLLMSSDNPGSKINVRRLYVENHEQMARVVEDAIDCIALEFAETAHHRKDRTEDGLTIDIVSALKSMGFRATHDEDVGGHCDVIVRGPNNFLWAGEAKKHDAYEWLAKGYKQLIDRYSTGNPGQDVGGLIIYVKTANTRLVMERWKARFEEAFPGVVTTQCDRFPLALVSTLEHPRSGLPFRLRHVPISLHHSPTDRE